MLKTIKDTIMAGIYISIGAISYLAIPNKIVGACFFTGGIFLVINYHNMLTTKVIPTYFAKLGYRVKDIIFAILGNSIGAMLVAFLISFSRLATTMEEYLVKIVDTKLSDNYLSLLIMAIFCGILVAYASLTSRKYKNGSFAQIFYTAIFIMIFVLCGFDHVVANVFYFTLYSLLSGVSIQMLPNLLVVLIGNFIGGAFVGLIERENLKDVER